MLLLNQILELCLHKVRGIEQSNIQAHNWFSIAYENGYQNASTNLEIVSESMSKSDIAQANYELGYMYYSGEIIEQNFKNAAKWFSLAAEQGSHDAQYNLAIMHYHGDGVVKSNIYSYMWFDILSSLGDEDAKERREFVAGQMKQNEILKAKKVVKAMCIQQL